MRPRIFGTKLEEFLWHQKSGSQIIFDSNMIGRFFLGDHSDIACDEIEGLDPNILKSKIRYCILGSRISRGIISRNGAIGSTPTVNKEHRYRLKLLKAVSKSFRNYHGPKRGDYREIRGLLQELICEEERSERALKDTFNWQLAGTELDELRSYRTFVMETSETGKNLDDENIVAEAIFLAVMNGKRTSIVTRDARFPSILKATYEKAESLKNVWREEIYNLLANQGVSIIKVGERKEITREYDTRLEAVLRAASK